MCLNNKSVVTVSVVMATYNENVEFIRNSIESILNQTYHDFELIILDDSTCDNTINAINEYQYDSRVKILRSDKRLGFVRSLNKGLLSSRGKYIARMDGDDIAINTRFENEVKYLEEHQDVDIIGGQINQIDKNGNIISKRKYPLRGIKLSIFSCFRSPLAHPTVMMRRKIVDDGHLYNERLNKAEDVDLWLRLLNCGYKIENIPETVLNYRISDDFIAKRGSDDQRLAVAEVRRNNFSSEHLIRSIAWQLTAWLMIHMPKKILSSIYHKENNQ